MDFYLDGAPQITSSVEITSTTQIWRLLCLGTEFWIEKDGVRIATYAAAAFTTSLYLRLEFTQGIQNLRSVNLPATTDVIDPFALQIPRINMLGVHPTSNFTSFTNIFSAGTAGFHSNTSFSNATSLAIGIQFRPAQSNLQLMVGLSFGNTDVSQTDIDFGVRCNNNGTAETFHQNNLISSFSYAANDLFTITTNGTYLVTKHNGVAITEIQNTLSFPLLVDTSFTDPNAQINDVKIVQECPSGSSGTHECQPCQKGYFTSTTGQTSCTKCPVGK
eukprot:TRINITY_DN2387_c0_g1_i31.p1 TRINITY_DN2387_c0_g1~~TRINITY_DN2387_c0_g1_i31.p1  ORF type:complete len:303 (+),score=56.59 TRINITY_DN2387_c0_g1_i31:86-910(+)